MILINDIFLVFYLKKEEENEETYTFMQRVQILSKRFECSNAMLCSARLADL